MAVYIGDLKETSTREKKFDENGATIMEINYWTNGKTCAKVVFPRYTVKFRSQNRERASKRKPYRGLGTR